MASTDRIQGLRGDLAIKAPCRVGTTTNITLAGLQTIDGVALAAGDRVLVKDQTDTTENGLYSAAAGAWPRTKDFDGIGDVVNGTQVLITEGSVSAGVFYSVSADEPVIPGASAVVFADSAVAAGAVAAHAADPTAAHSASAISYAGSSGLVATDVEAALDELDSEKQAANADIPTVSASQAEMEAGTEAALRSMSPLRVKQAISALGSSFTAGTRMVFHQTAAPTGWTKDTSINDKALRVVSGTVGSGGSVAFSTVFGRQATDAHTLTTAEMPSHSHAIPTDAIAGGGSSPYFAPDGTFTTSNFSGTTGASGSGGAHSHNIDLRVQYVDIIVAQKD